MKSNTQTLIEFSRETDFNPLIQVLETHSSLAEARELDPDDVILMNFQLPEHRVPSSALHD